MNYNDKLSTAAKAVLDELVDEYRATLVDRAEIRNKGREINAIDFLDIVGEINSDDEKLSSELKIEVIDRSKIVFMVNLLTALSVFMIIFLIYQNRRSFTENPIDFFFIITPLLSASLALFASYYSYRLSKELPSRSRSIKSGLPKDLERDRNYIRIIRAWSKLENAISQRVIKVYGESQLTSNVFDQIKLLHQGRQLTDVDVALIGNLRQLRNLISHGKFEEVALDEENAKKLESEANDIAFRLTGSL